MMPLVGMRVVSLAVYVPGPIAAARLRAMGAEVTKVEPPGGDPLQQIAPGWYAELVDSQTVVRLDLKDLAGRTGLDALLAAADLLLTASRPAALRRLGLGWTELHARHPTLCHVAVVGEPGTRTERPGHDLTYQATAGLLDPPRLPRTLLADLAGAEQTVAAALALLLARERGAGAARAEVALSDAAAGFAPPLRHGLTAPGGLLGGGEPAYGIYPASEGWVAVAALEPHFRERLARELEVETLSADELSRVFHTRTAAEWEAWAAERDLPLAAVHGSKT
jgi:crotonobetainyl-CoA:carnitine CoA-transferase CaiB-like acyl-CoA transferase